ncbi:MAG: FUSC family protein [Solirubrobacteraceae bacterium]
MATTSTLTTAVRQAGRFDRRAVSWRGGLMAAIPVVLTLGIPIAAGDPVAGSAMGAGAMLVGIAWRAQGGRPPLGVMGADALLMALATFAGCISGSVLWVHLVVLAALSFGGGMLTGVGNRGGVVGNQAIIAAVVFGRFPQAAGQAAGLAGLVFAGGTAQVLFLAVVRWPAPLRAQRRDTAAAYRALAALAGAPGRTSSMPAANVLDTARAGMSAPALFGDSALTALRSLLEEGFRMRVALTAIRALSEHVETHERARAAVAAARHRAVVALDLAARVINGDSTRAGELTAEIGRLSRELEDARQDGAFVTDDPVTAILERRLAALAGQLRAVAVLAPAAASSGGLRSRRPHRAIDRPLRQLRQDLWQLRADLNWESPIGRHAVRLAVVVPAAELIARQLPLSRGYWMVVAAAAVLRPEYGATFTRGAERALGTTLGAGLAGLIAATLHPSGGATIALVGLMAWLAYSTFPASFTTGFGFITALVVFLLNVVNPDTLATAGARLLDTLVGGALGLIVFALWPTWSEAPARDSLADLLGALRKYLSDVLGAYTTGKRPPGDELRRTSRQLRLARVNAESRVARSLSEPVSRRVDPERAQGALATILRLTQGAHVLRLEAQEHALPAPSPELADFSASLDRLLAAGQAALRSGARLPTRSLPDLRAEYEQLVARNGGVSPELLAELDEFVDAANGLVTIVAARPQD